uniref:SWIM-type domain-containing protein n=1 Tax=Lactuca sativa TaxID=4236 RepID=A0A9R1WSW8_LACSA|nr:hypothetical protein LSAT_V11C900464790 [Lactuca sativa]
MDQTESNPTIPVKALQEQLQKEYQVGFSIHKVFGDKSTAKTLVQGNYEKKYDVLRDYILELLSTNSDTTVKSHLCDNIVAFLGRVVSYMLLNNLCEVFNSKLIEGRDKPLTKKIMVRRLESCRKWELTRFHCKHVIAVLNDKEDNGEKVGELHTYAHRVHWLETWKTTYVYKVVMGFSHKNFPISRSIPLNLLFDLVVLEL